MTPEQWNQFVVEHSSPASFLQSWQWGEFQEALGNKIYRVEIGESIKAQVIVRKLPLNRAYLEIPKGPLADESRITNHELWADFVDKLRAIGKEEKAVLARVNPPYENLDLQNQDFRKPEILMRQMEPARTILVDLPKSEEELMQNMHEKSRYNLRLAMRKGVRVRRATQDKLAFEKFLQLLEETARRDKIVSWGRERFWKFREKFMTADSKQDTAATKQPHAELLVGELEGQILAAAIIMLFGDSGTYLYAASSAENRPANAPSLVLWEAILESRRQGRKWYDMWGVAPADEPNHPWAGITRFKSRYVKLHATGREFFGSGTHDLVLAKSFYWLFKVAKKIRP